MQDRKPAVFHGTRSIVKGRDEQTWEEIAQLFPLCIPLIYQACPFPLALLIPFLQVSSLPFPHCTEFQNTDLLRACRRIFSFMGLKFRCSHLYITFFNCSLKQNKWLVMAMNFSPLQAAVACQGQWNLQSFSPTSGLLGLHCCWQMDIFNLAATYSLRQRGESVNRESIWKIGFFSCENSSHFLHFFIIFKVKKNQWSRLGLAFPPAHFHSSCFGSSEHL